MAMGMSAHYPVLLCSCVSLLQAVVHAPTDMFSTMGFVCQLVSSARNMSSRALGGKSVDLIRKILPSLSHDLHKGECGRICVIGGSKEYTGAPYYAAISALKTGGDLAHVICPSEAASVIKSYSPELIVHPILDEKDVSEIKEWLDRFHAVVLGPGLGRSLHLVPLIREITDDIKRKNLPLIVDADGLFYVTKDPNLIKNYPRAILTPNVVEFVRLYHSVTDTNPDRNSAEPETSVRKLSRELGNVVIVQKGLGDIISDGNKVLVCSETGSHRRCGGQGDLLSGSLGTFAAWAATQKELEYGPWMTAAYAACYLTKECNARAFAELGRSTTTVDMIESISRVMHHLSH